MKKEQVTTNDENEEYPMPPECEQSEQELERISLDERKTHYDVINLFAIVITMIVASAVFLLLTGEKRAMKVENPLTLKTFLSGEYTAKLEESYVKSLPYQYEFKNGNEKLSFFYGIGNKIKKYKDFNEGIVIVSDDDIEKKKVSIKQNEEKVLDNMEKDEEVTPEETKKTKKTIEKKTETGAQRIDTTTRRTTTTTTTTKETTTLTTTNNDAPDVKTTTTIPPSVTYDYSDSEDVAPEDDGEVN